MIQTFCVVSLNNLLKPSNFYSLTYEILCHQWLLDIALIQAELIEFQAERIEFNEFQTITVQMFTFNSIMLYM